ncbi:MAG: hypothetical protein P4L53_01195 [Candidatus Obscuribacterales bacterium]|nr:hypothetical protein [Candidatus Obscuribacterales bacterium]
MNFLQNIAIQFAFLYAPLVHCVSEQVTPVLYRGPDPKVKDIYALHDKGVKTIISLRTNPEHDKERLCQKLGMKWVQIKTGVFKTPSADQFDQFRSIVNDPKQQPIYASCEIDMDRTGVYIAAMRMVDQHWTAAQMDDEFRLHHQKRWWPIFRKYQRVVTEYADSRLAKLPSDSSATNNDIAAGTGAETSVGSERNAASFSKEPAETLSVDAKKLVK